MADWAKALEAADKYDAWTAAQWKALLDAIAVLSVKLDRVQALVNENGRKIDKIARGLGVED